MLSRPLPEDIAIPAGLPAFVLQLLDDAVQDVSAGSLRPLYLTIKGVGASLIGVLPPGKLTHLQEELIKILRKLDHSASLHCLAIFATLCADKQCEPVAEDASSSQESDSYMRSASTQARDIYQPARQFFGSKKASKTLDLVILRAIQLCSSASKIGPAQPIETLQLARQIFEAVEPAAKAIWVQKNAAKIRKLNDKVRPSEVDVGVRLAAFELTGSLTDILSVPHDLVTSVEKLLQRPLTGYSVQGITQAYAERFSDEFIILRFTRALGAATECDLSDMATVDELTGLKCLVNCLAEAVKSSSLIRQTLLVALSSNKLQQPFQRFLTCRIPDAASTTRHERHMVCPAHIQDSRRSLQREICRLLLRSAFFATFPEVALDPSVAAALLDKLTESPFLSNPCQVFRPRLQSRSSLPLGSDVSNMPLALRSDEDWRNVLKEDLDRDSAYRYDRIIQGIGNVCRDLEARCNEVEKPLNDELERSRCLQSQLDLFKERCNELEGQLQEQTLVLDSLQAERSHLLIQKQLAERSTQTVSEALDEAHAQLRLAHSGAATAALASGEELRRLELVHFATIVAKDEMIETGKAKSSSLESQLDHLHEQLGFARQEISASRATLVSAEGTVTERDAKIEELQHVIQMVRDDLGQQKSISRQASGELEIIKQEMVALRSEGDSMRAEHERHMLELNMTASESQGKLEYALSALNAEMSQQKSRSEETIATLRDESAWTRNEQMRLSKEYERNTADLMRKIELLSKERDMRAKEFAEAQDLSSKLMALMGKNPTPSVAATAGFSPSSEQPVRHTAVAAISDHENIQSVPQGSSAPRTAPKRLRVRRGSQTPSRHQSMMAPRHRTVRGSLDGTGREKRQPLEELECNVQHAVASVPARQPVAEVHDIEPHQDDTAMQIEENGMSQVMCDISFGESCLFTSTDHRKLSTQDFPAGQGVYEETTGDF